jgi:hypothetical protein
MRGAGRGYLGAGMNAEWTNWHEKHSDKIVLVAGVDCWIWGAGATPSRRHGRVAWNRKGEYAHRAAFAAHNGEMPKEGMVCHACGVGLCVRPGHLYLGDAASNGFDMAVMQSGTGKLRPDQVTALRLDYMSGVSLDQIASKYGVAYGTVYPVVVGKSYRHVPMPDGMIRAARCPHKLSESDVQDIRILCASGRITQDRIARAYGVAGSVISRIHTGHRHGSVPDALHGDSETLLARVADMLRAEDDGILGEWF